MSPLPWTTPAQTEWLASKKETCQDARDKGRYSSWLLGVYHDFFIKWPESDVLFLEKQVSSLTEEEKKMLTTAEEKRRTRIARWFQNHNSPSRVARAAAAQLPHEVFASGKVKRAPQLREVYMDMYYDAPKKASVAARLQQDRIQYGRKLTRAETMSLTRQYVDQLFAAEPENVRTAVAVRHAKEKTLHTAPTC
ncbi:hypothetical protein C8Q78DRAFT_1078168 [Trametes maxima]|nr:hypothetical protein C8Q78DRAFT_1078168 [Trametes maxima]